MPSGNKKDPGRQLEAMAEEIFELTKMGWAAREQARRHCAIDLSEAEVLTLEWLCKEGTLCVGDLQRRAGVLPAQMSRIIRSLEGKAEGRLIQCAINPDDKRKIDVAITDLGRRAYGEYRSAKLASALRILGELEPSDRDEFMRILRIMKGLFAKYLQRK